MEPISVALLDTFKSVGPASSVTIDPPLLQQAVQPFDSINTESEVVKADSTRLQILQAEPDPLQKVFGAFSEMDAGYQKLAKSLVDGPTFQNYLNDRGLHSSNSTQGLATTEAQHVSNFHEIESQGAKHSIGEIVRDLRGSVNEQVSYMKASSDFAQERSKWTHMVEIWATKMKVMTAAVKQVNTGLKTLFQSQ